MTDREKVIKELECCVSLNHNGPKCANCDYADEFHNGDCETYLLRDALALLKAQEPLKPVRDTSYGARPWWYVCGNCKLSVNEDQKYCPNCGRAVKWE